MPNFKMMIGIATVNRKDLLMECLQDLDKQQNVVDKILIIDNGNQGIETKHEVIINKKNWGIPKSINYFLQYACDNSYQRCCVLNDDIVWGPGKVVIAKKLSKKHHEIDMLCSDYQLSVMIFNPQIIKTVGLWDEAIYPGSTADDDFTLRMTLCGSIYKRFPELDPIVKRFNGSGFGHSWTAFRKKWGPNVSFAVNHRENEFYITNENYDIRKLTTNKPLQD